MWGARHRPVGLGPPEGPEGAAEGGASGCHHWGPSLAPPWISVRPIRLVRQGSGQGVLLRSTKNWAAIIGLVEGGVLCIGSSAHGGAELSSASVSAAGSSNDQR